LTFKGVSPDFGNFFMQKDSRTIYAQSSDIKSRTYLEYRKDMKKKAIVELEILPWLARKLKEKYPQRDVRVAKAGGDKFLWFLRQGGISREPDFIAELGSQNLAIEFQYGGEDIKPDYVFDFKTSKVAKKNKGGKKRIPKDVLFLYAFRGAPDKFAFIPAKWILSNATEGVAPAWGNREVYKITGRQMLPKVKRDSHLPEIWRLIEAKLGILEFQHHLLDINKDKFSYLLQAVIDQEKVVSIIPRDFSSFFKVCFILDHMNKIPRNANLWLIYLLTFIRENMLLEEISEIIYCIDFLYPKVELKQNELELLKKQLGYLLAKIKSFYQKDGTYRSSLQSSALEETRWALFSINILEDLIQDMIYYYSVTDIKPIRRIYENVDDVEKTYKIIESQH